MKRHTKDVIQYGSGVAMMATGIILSVASFFWLKYIHASVLTYMGEAVGFCSGLYGLTVYSRTKANEVREDLLEEFNALKRQLLNQDNGDETLYNERDDA